MWKSRTRMMARKAFGFLSLGGALLIVASCSVLTEEQCVAGNWQEIGFEDGLAGRGGDQFWQNRVQCAGFGEGADRDAWWAGNSAGLAQYCTAETAFELGRTGGRIEAVCTPEQYADGMPEAFVAGQQSFAADLSDPKSGAE